VACFVMPLLIFLPVGCVTYLFLASVAPAAQWESTWEGPRWCSRLRPR
jgi:hypothetical protein